MKKIMYEEKKRCSIPGKLNSSLQLCDFVIHLKNWEYNASSRRTNQKDL